MIYFIIGAIAVVGAYVAIMQFRVKRLKAQKEYLETQVKKWQLAFSKEKAAHAQTIANIRKKEEYDEQERINAEDKAREDAEIANASDDSLLSLLQNPSSDK